MIQPNIFAGKRINRQNNKIAAVILIILVFSFAAVYSKSANNNRFIPGKLPSGFVFARTPEFYGTYEKPGKNGTIYDYINGGGEVYIKHGFHQVTHIVLKDNERNSITLDIFNMGTPGNAAATFADEAVCPQGFTEVNIGTVSKTYHYEPDFLVYFVKGKYFVYLAVTNDALKENLVRFAADIYRAIK